DRVRQRAGDHHQRFFLSRHDVLSRRRVVRPSMAAAKSMLSRELRAWATPVQSSLTGVFETAAAALISDIHGIHDSLSGAPTLRRMADVEPSLAEGRAKTRTPPMFGTACGNPAVHGECATGK